MPGDPWVCLEHRPFLQDLFTEGLAQTLFGNRGASLLCGSICFLHPFFHETFTKVLQGGQSGYYLPSFFRCGNQGLRMQITCPRFLSQQMKELGLLHTSSPRLFPPGPELRLAAVLEKSEKVAGGPKDSVSINHPFAFEAHL